MVWSTGNFLVSPTHCSKKRQTARSKLVKPFSNPGPTESDGCSRSVIKDLREVAGLTITELGDAINLKDRTFWEAVEDGTATISFGINFAFGGASRPQRSCTLHSEIYARTYNPDLWRILNDWGLGRLPLHYEREREFINIYRRHDAARNPIR